MQLNELAKVTRPVDGRSGGEGRECLQAMLRLSWSLFLRGQGHLLRVLSQGRPGLLPTSALGLWTRSLSLLIQEREIKQSISPGTLKGLGDTLHANTQPSA